jgi:splicing factor 3B subunit 4
MSGNASGAIEQRNQEATAYCGNLEEKCSEEMLWELMIQAGPVVSVHMPRDKVTGLHQGYGFVEFRTEEDADYAVKVMNMIRLFGKPVRVNKASSDKKALDVGANLFVGQLDSAVDEKLMYDTFSAFGHVTQTPKIMRDLDTGNSKGFGFVSFDNFESSDLAIECMNGQFLCGRQIVVQYAYKRDSPGERHGSQAERMLALNNKPSHLKPNTMFATQQGMASPAAASGGNAMPQHQPGQMQMMPGMQHMPPPPPPPMAGYPPPPTGYANGGYYGMPPGVPPPLPGALPYSASFSGMPIPPPPPQWGIAGMPPPPPSTTPFAPPPPPPN